jgi:hypothetical protein
VPIAVTSGLYFAGRAVIKERAYLETGGQWTDTESLMNIGTVAMGVLPEASGGLRFLGMARALNMTRSETLLAAFGVARTTGSISAVGDVGGFGRVWYALPHAQQFGTYLETAGGLNTVAHVTDAAGMLIGAGQTGYSAVNLAEHGGDMSGIDLIKSLTNIGIGITGTGLGARSFLNYAGGPHATSMSFTDASGQRVNAIVAVDDRPASEDQVYIPSPDDGPVTVAGLVSAGYTHVLVRDPQTNQAVVVPLTSGKGPSTAKTTDSMVTTSDVTVASALLQDTPEGVEAAIEAAHPDYVADIPSAAGLVTKLDDASFNDTVAGLYRARGQNLPDDIGNINAVIVRDPVTDEVTDIFIRQSVASNPQVLAHELYHAKASRGFRTVAQSLLVKLGNRYSNLSEGAVDYLVEKLFGDSLHTVSTQEALAVRDIIYGWGEGDARVEGIGEEAFYNAFFKGDKSALRAFIATARLHPGVEDHAGVTLDESGQPDSVEPMVNPGKGATPPVAPALAAGDRVYPVHLWPIADASIFNGTFQGDATVHLYAVPVDPGQREQPLTFETSDIAAHASVAWDDLDVKWNDASTGNPIGQFGKTVNQRFAKLTASLPEGKVWAVVASNASIDDVRAGNGLTDVDWVLDRQQIPGQSGTAYEPPGFGTHGEGFLGLSDKYHLGVRSHGLGQAVVFADRMMRRASGYVFRDEQGWVKKGTSATDGRYISRTVVASVGKPIPVVDPASGRDTWVDAHNHAGTFIHPIYITPKAYVDRIATAAGQPGIANVRPANEGGPLPGVVITLQHIPYLVQRGARWGNYTDQDVGSTTQVYAHLDDWKLLHQVEELGSAYKDSVIPSITGLQAWREKGYGSNIVTKEYIEHLSLYFHPTDLSLGAENRAAYPISGENTLYAKEVYSLLAGRGRQTRTPLLPDVFGPEVATDLATILNTYEVLRDAGIVTVTHKDSSFAQFLSDGRPVGAPGDDRYFFKEMMLDMALGPYDVSGLRFGDPDFVLSDSEIDNIVQQGGVQRPLASIVAHFQLGNFTRASAQHFDLAVEAANHPLMPHRYYDSSWLPSIEAQLQESRSGQPLWVRNSPGARPTFNGAYLDLIRSGKTFYGGDQLNIQTSQQQFAPWYAQQPPLRAIEGDVVPGTTDSLLAHYGGAGFMKLYQDSKPAIDWFRYRAYKGISYDKVSGNVTYDGRTIGDESRLRPGSSTTKTCIRSWQIRIRSVRTWPPIRFRDSRLLRRSIQEPRSCGAPQR